MIEFFFSLLSVLFLVGIASLILFFGMAMMGTIITCGVILGVYIILRGYWLRWKYGSNSLRTGTPPDMDSQVIDAEYEHVPDEGGKYKPVPHSLDPGTRPG